MSWLGNCIDTQNQLKLYVPSHSQRYFEDALQESFSTKQDVAAVYVLRTKIAATKQNNLHVTKYLLKGLAGIGSLSEFDDGLYQRC